MITSRKQAFDLISRTWAITRYDIEHHQQIGDLSMNIHGENYFRDLFNELYNLRLENVNFESLNSECIDLADHSKKIAIQITTTRTKEKIVNTLNALKKPEYKNYTILIFYLLDKSSPTTESIKELEATYNVSMKDVLKDYTDVITEINNLAENRLLEICKKFFSKESSKYTDHMALDLAIKHLLKTAPNKKKYYDDNFGSVEVNDKLQLNNINERISAYIKVGLDYQSLVTELEADSTLTDLRNLVINDLYYSVLIEEIKTRSSDYKSKNSVAELQAFASSLQIDFNKLVSKLYDRLIERIEISDFNSINIGWVIIGFFFELCDVGVYQK